VGSFVRAWLNPRGGGEPAGASHAATDAGRCSSAETSSSPPTTRAVGVPQPGPEGRAGVAAVEVARHAGG